MRIFAAVWKKYSEASHDFIESIDVTGKVSFGTQLHGGFAAASLKVDGPRDATNQRYRYYLGAHVVLMDMYGRRLYEGFVSQVSISETGLDVTTTGYYTRAGNLFFDNIYVAIEATTNYIRNPSFEINVTDSWWLAGGSRERYSADYKFGSACAKLTQATGANPSLSMYTDVEIPAGVDGTLSLWVKQIDVQGTPEIRIDERDSGLNVLKSTSRSLSGMADNSWIAFELSITTIPNVTNVAIYITCDNAETPGSFLVDGVMFERKPYSSGYCDGDQGALYHWTGTAHNSNSYRDAWSETVAGVIEDCINMITDWQPLMVHVANATAYIGSMDFTEKKVKDSIEEVLKLGYKESDFRPIYFAIWDYRQPFLFPEPTPGSYPNWFLSVNSLVGGKAGISQSLDDVYNKIYAVYDNQGEGPSKTLPASSYLSQQRFGVREGLLQNGSNPEGIVLAEALRDMALERYKYPRQVFSVSVSGLVRHSAGYWDFPYRIRAGQQVLLTDLDPITSLAGTLSGQVAHGLSGFVLRTEYDSGSNTTTIDFGSVDASFDVLMGRLGLSGGLS